MRTMVWNLALDAIGLSAAFRADYRTNDEVRAILTKPSERYAKTTTVRTAAQADDLIIEIGRTDRSRVAGATDTTALAFVLARCMAELGQMSKQPDTDEADLRFATVKRKEEKARRAGGAEKGKADACKRNALCKVILEMLKAEGAEQKRPPLKIKLLYDETSKAEARKRMTDDGVELGNATYPSKNIFQEELTKARKLLKTGN